MISILSFIKRYWLEILCAIGIIVLVFTVSLDRGNDGGESEDIRQIRTELNEIRDSNERILDGFSKYAESSRERDEDIAELREYIGSEIRGLTATIEDARQTDLTAGDRAIESGLLIDENRRLLRELREGE